MICLGLAFPNRQPRMLLLDHYAQHLVQVRVHRDRHDILARHHDLPHRQLRQVEHPVDHFLLRLGQKAHAAAGTDDQLQFLGRVAAARRTRARSPRIRVMAAADVSIATTKGSVDPIEDQ